MKQSVFFLFFIFSFVQFTYADMGPKPKMVFSIQYEDDLQSTFVRLIQLQYHNADGSDMPDSLHEETRRGPEGLDCASANSCNSLAYSYRPYHKLMLVLTHDTLYSPIFEKQAFNSSYSVIVSKSGLKVENTTSWFMREVEPYSFIRAVVITLTVEMLGMFVLLMLFGYPDKKPFLWAVLFANLISLPIFWFGIMNLMNSSLGWIMGELFVLVFETLFVWFFTKKVGSLGRMAVLVFILNFLSMLAGGAFWFLLMAFS